MVKRVYHLGGKTYYLWSIFTWVFILLFITGCPLVAVGISALVYHEGYGTED